MGEDEVRTGSKKKLANAALEFQHDHSSGRRKPGWDRHHGVSMDRIASLLSTTTQICVMRDPLLGRRRRRRKNKSGFGGREFLLRTLKKRAGIGYYFLFSFFLFQSVLLDQRYLSSPAVFIFSFIFWGFIFFFFLSILVSLNFLERSFDPSIHPSLVDDVLWSKPVVPIREKDKRKKDKRKKDKKIGDVLDLKAQTSISSLVDQHKLK